MFLVDSHCHLDMLNKNIDDILKKAEKNCIKYILCVSTSVSNYFKCRMLLKGKKNISYTCGIHPLYYSKYKEKDQLYKIASKKKIIAIGETGLDYYYSNKNKKEQQKLFEKHLYVAKKLKKPIIIHTRCARKDTIIALEKEKKVTGVIHCFSEDLNTAKKFLDMGFYISFSGIITFNNADLVRKSLNFVPLDRLLLETDSPYLSPVPYRGKENQPSRIKNIAEFISKIKKINLETIAENTTKNFFTLFFKKF